MTKVSAAGGRVYNVLRAAVAAWLADNAASMGAAVAFYAIFSFVPVLLVVTAVAGWAVGRGPAEREMFLRLQGLIGSAGATAVQALADAPAGRKLGGWAGAVGLLTLFGGASGAFVELQDSLNRIWKAKPNPRGFLDAAVRQYLFSLTIVVGGGLLWMVLLVAATVFPLEHAMPGRGILARALYDALHFFLNALVLAVLYKAMPSASVAWRDVWFGAVVASLLFSGAKALIGAYLARSTLVAAYGPAGSLVIMLVWIYFAVQFSLFGAEVTHAWSRSPA